MSDEKAPALAILLRDFPKLSAGVGRIHHPVLDMMMRHVAAELQVRASEQGIRSQAADRGRAQPSTR